MSEPEMKYEYAVIEEMPLEELPVEEKFIDCNDYVVDFNILDCI